MMNLSRPPEESKSKRIIIVGAGEFAEIAYEYFTHDSPLNVEAFCVERDFMHKSTLNGLPVIALDELHNSYPPKDFSVYIAITYTKLNRVRARLYEKLKSLGYQFENYISSKAFVWHNVKLGENVFIFENNVIQSNVVLGNNIVLWSGNHIGHRTEIADHCYLASHIVVSGYCKIGRSTFIGVNATLADHVEVGADCLIGAGTLILQDVPDDSLVPGTNSRPSAVSSRRFHRIRES